MSKRNSTITKKELLDKLEKIQKNILAIPLTVSDVSASEDAKIQDTLHELEVAIRQASRVASY